MYISGQTAWLQGLIWSFTVRICLKAHFHMNGYISIFCSITNYHKQTRALCDLSDNFMLHIVKRARLNLVTLSALM